VEAGTRPQPRRRGGVVGPLILIFIGGVFLLQNMGLLPPDTWTNLWRLWPIVLVLVGVELLLGNRVHWLGLTAIVACLFVVGIFATAGPPASTEVATRNFDQPLNSATRANVSIRFDAGELNVGLLPEARTNLLSSMMYTGPAEPAPRANYSVDNGNGRLEYVVNGRRGLTFGHLGERGASPRMDVQLAPNVALMLSLRTGATDARLDLTGLRVTSLDIEMGAASATIRLPQAAGMTTAEISGGAATINLEVPQDVAAQIRHRGGLSTLSVDEGRFPRVGEQMYRSTNYETAANKVDISLETGVATVRVS
jgi:hypothetical protein